MHYENISKFVTENIRNNHLRTDCPVCYNKNTFSAIQKGNLIFYNCFHVDCKTKGIINAELTLDFFRDIGNYSTNNNDNRNSCKFPIFYGDGNQRTHNFSAEFVPANSHNCCIEFLSRFSITDCSSLKYDPKQHRLVFPLEWKGENYGYTGRYLGNASTTSKWYVYLRRMGCPFIRNGPNNCAIIVEDCVSAMRGMAITSHISLLGTSISIETIPYLLEYERLYVALDPDASKKAIEIQKQLAYYRPTKLLVLEKDLKYYTDEQLQHLKQQIKD